MERKQIFAGTAIAVAVLLPIGQWILASRQEAAGIKASQQVERDFIAQRAAAAGVQPPQDGGRWGAWDGGGPRPGGPGSGARRRPDGQRGQGRARRMEE